jgi:hypothetical protein
MRRGKVYPDKLGSDRKAVGTVRKLEAFVRCKAMRLTLDRYAI